MNDFKDDDFDNFDDGNFDDFSSGSTLKDSWQNNPVLKIFIVVAVIIAVVAAILIFSGKEDERDSRLSRGLDQSETLGGEISPNYEEALEDVNRQRLETAQRTGNSTIPMLINPEEQELLTETEELPPYQEFDPLASFRANVEEAQPFTPENPAPEPTLVAPEQVFTQQAQPVPAPSPEAVQNLAQAMSASISDIIGNHSPKAARINQITASDYLQNMAANDMNMNSTNVSSQMVDTDGDGIPDTELGVELNDDSGSVAIETVLVPSGTINYAQVLIEANSDVPGPVLVQLVSGPLAGARMIGSFSVMSDLLVLTFNSIIIDGLNQPVNAIALDPNSTLPGIASEVNQRYFKRVLLPAAAKFLEGVGSAIAQDSQTTVTVSGDTVIQETEALDFEQELGRGVEASFGEISEFMQDEADDTEPMVRVSRGTPIGVFFLQPVLEEQN